MALPCLPDLDKFCSLKTDRFLFLQQWLTEHQIEHILWQLGNYRHWVLMPGGKKSYQKENRKKVLIAHYDRVENTPGANDNSASVLQLIRLAENLQQSGKRHNCLIILTDGEELQHQQNLKDQGAYLLAEKLKDLGFTDSLMIIMDLCGRGDTMVCGTSRQRRINHQGYQERRPEDRDLPLALEEIILRFSRGQQIQQLRYFSDDLGFLAHAFPTVLISLLPWKERDFLEQGIMPPSWSSQHTMEDRVEDLESRSFRIMESFLEALSNLII